jgi:ubiquinone/menaquinone biosynthesis C-methylase UbiE
MSIDSDHLKTVQYHNAARLSARIRLHEQFSTNPESLQRWFFDHLLQLAPEHGRILEIGCGRGDIWKQNGDRIPAGWQITLTDFSAGMLADCRAYLGPEMAGRFAYEVVDAQSIPNGANRYDIVIANHMLYHVPDRPQAIAEIRRVLKPSGFFLCMTNGDQHLRELMALGERFIPALAAERNRKGFITENFSLENGPDQLRTQFESVTVERFNNDLFVTSVQPILDYIGSMEAALPGQSILAQNEQLLRAELEQRMVAEGGIRITKAAGLLIAH